MVPGLEEAALAAEVPLEDRAGSPASEPTGYSGELVGSELVDFELLEQLFFEFLRPAEPAGVVVLGFEQDPVGLVVALAGLVVVVEHLKHAEHSAAAVVAAVALD